MSALTSLEAIPEPSVDRAEIDRWAQVLEGKDPDTIIRFAFDTFGSSLAVATQFGVEGSTLLHRVSQIQPDAYVFTIDTGLLFQETYRLAERLEKRLGITIHRIHPQQSVAEQAVSQGANLWERDPDLCCTLRKVLPMQEALAGRRAWMTGLRRGQSSTRENTPVVQWDERFEVVKFSPLAGQSQAEIESYIAAHKIPTNPLRQVGFTSIGCFPCTRPVKDGEDNRAGRWWRSEKTECGLHGR